MAARALAVVALLAAAGCIDGRQRALADLRGVKLSPVRAKPDFVLDDTQGKPFHFAADTRGTVTLLYFGYTNCPDVCPVQMGVMANAIASLPASEQSKVRVVFVTTDPDRDTPERLRAWLDNFDKRFVGLRGSLDEINRIAASVGLPPATVEVMPGMKPGPRPVYAIGHAAQVLAFSPDDSLHAEYPGGFTRDDWKHDLPDLMKIVSR